MAKTICLLCLSRRRLIRLIRLACSSGQPVGCLCTPVHIKTGKHFVFEFLALRLLVSLMFAAVSKLQLLLALLLRENLRALCVTSRDKVLQLEQLSMFGSILLVLVISQL